MNHPTDICPHCGQRMPPARYCARPDCGREFRGRRADAVYCSRACAKVMAQRARRQREGGGTMSTVHYPGDHRGGGYSEQRAQYLARQEGIT